MNAKILRPCSICKRYGAAYRVHEEGVTRSYCYACWKAKFARPQDTPKNAEPPAAQFKEQA